MHSCPKSFSKQARFKDLINAVQHCTLCPRLCNRSKVLSAKNGNIESRVLFVAEAPGRLGADRTGIPLYGDQTGDNFEKLLGNVGWNREDIFITNALLCNPRQKNGNNGTPTAEEIANCSYYLDMTVELVSPDVVVSMGTTALRALEHIYRHGLSLKENVATPMPWAGRLLVPLYHPGPRALVHRAFAKQTSDFMRLAKLAKPLSGIIGQKNLRQRRKAELSPDKISPFQHLICLIVQTLGKITYFRLTKLLYLIDLAAIDRLGHTITGEIYLRQPEGPWPPALQKMVPALKQQEISLSSRRGMLSIQPGPSPRFEATLDETALEIVADIIARYGHLSNARIKSVAYTTGPMRYVLAQERQGRDIRNFPIIYKGKKAPDTDEKK